MLFLLNVLINYILVLTLEVLCKESNATFVRSLVADEEIIRPSHWFGWHNGGVVWMLNL